MCTLIVCFLCSSHQCFGWDVDRLFCCSSEACWFCIIFSGQHWLEILTIGIQTQMLWLGYALFAFLITLSYVMDVNCFLSQLMLVNKDCSLKFKWRDEHVKSFTDFLMLQGEWLYVSHHLFCFCGSFVICLYVASSWSWGQWHSMQKRSRQGFWVTEAFYLMICRKHTRSLAV